MKTFIHIVKYILGHWGEITTIVEEYRSHLDTIHRVQVRPGFVLALARFGLEVIKAKADGTLATEERGPIMKSMWDVVNHVEGE